MATPTRDIILRTLRSQGRASVTQLAVAAEVSPVSVRHHLANLQAEGLVGVEEQKHGVGRPRHMFFLTERGMDLAPGRYHRLTNRLLDEIKGSMAGDQIEQLFNGVAASMSEAYAVSLDGLPLEDKLERLVVLLSEEGFDARIERTGGQLLIREMSCPYYRIGLQHPEVCSIDQAFIARALDLPVERVTCLLGGDAHCTFAIDALHPPKESIEHVR
jgi:DeoR family suf operon transcriptional repressor